MPDNSKTMLVGTCASLPNLLEQAKEFSTNWYNAEDMEFLCVIWVLDHTLQILIPS